MKSYEGMFVLAPELDEGALEKLTGNLKDVITKHNGSVERTENLGKRQFAYRLKKKNEGIYLLAYFRAEPASISKLEAVYRLNESVLRTLIIKRGE